MTKDFKFLTLASLIIIGRLYDGITTYLYIPNLSYESNVIVKFLGAGWISLIIIQTILICLVIYSLYYYYFKFNSVQTSEENLTMKQYVSYFYFYDKDSFFKVFYKFPKNKSGFIASTGYVISMTLIYSSFIVGTSTTLLLISDTYKKIYKHGIPCVLYCIMIGLAIYFTMRFFRLEYNKNKK